MTQAMIALDRVDIEVLDDREALAQRAADWIVTKLLDADAPIRVALGGGSTPRPAYALLAAPPRRALVPWERVHWFWGDERYVPHDRADSNFRMALDAMLSHVPVPLANIHPISTQPLPPEKAAASYEALLRRFSVAGPAPVRTLFDVTLLGIGEDGHTASLFPGSAALAERTRWVVAVRDAKAGPRISLTLPALSNSRDIAFIAAGAEKRPALERLFDGASDLPLAQLDPVGAVHFFLDRAAAPARLG